MAQGFRIIGAVVKSKAMKMLKDGKNADAVGKALGVSGSSVRNWTAAKRKPKARRKAATAGYMTVVKPTKRGRDWATLREKARNLRSLGRAVKDIAKLLRVSQNSVIRWTKKAKTGVLKLAVGPQTTGTAGAPPIMVDPVLKGPSAAGSPRWKAEYVERRSDAGFPGNKIEVDATEVAAFLVLRARQLVTTVADNGNGAKPEDDRVALRRARDMLSVAADLAPGTQRYVFEMDWRVADADLVKKAMASGKAKAGGMA